jgi:hypothetical protein
MPIAWAASSRRRDSASLPSRASQFECASEPPADHAVGLALRLKNGRFVQLECAPHRRGRSLADEDLARRGRLLEPGADIDRIPGYERAAFPRAADDDVACVDTDPQGQFVPEQLGESALHAESRV